MKQVISILIIFFSSACTAQRDTIKVVMLTSDTCLNKTEYIYGYAVRELHNTVLDGTSVVSCCEEYWKEKFYLDENKQKLKGLIVWQSIQTNWSKKHITPT